MMINLSSLFKKIVIFLGTWLLVSCQTVFKTESITDQGLNLPFIKNSAQECYFLDEFMPVPNNLVSGRTGGLDLRYYTYNSAFYKDWPKSQVVLSFYSNDQKCWSLFEEYFIAQ